MNPGLELSIGGVGAWIRGAPDWTVLRGVLRRERGLDANAVDKPAAARLGAAERRRAPDNVRLAVEVAGQACAMARIDPAGVACVFASTYGELAITDEVCATLARAPLELSPTRFHNSVLNVAAGYWTIATACMAASSAVTAHRYSFSAGLLEAATLACADRVPVLLASSDIASAGPLAEMTCTSAAFGVAVVLVPAAADAPRLRWSTGGRADDPPEPPVPVLQHVARETSAARHALALLAALAQPEPSSLALPLSSGSSLVLEIVP